MNDIQKQMRKRRKPYINQMFKNNHLLFAITLAICLWVAIVNLIFSWVLQQIIDLVAGAETYFTVGQIGWVCGIVTAGLAVSLQIFAHCRSEFGRRAMQQYKELAFEKISRKKMEAFSEENTSRYLSALTNDASAIETDYLATLFQLLQEIVMCVGAFGMMIWYSPQLTAAAVVFSLLPVISSLLTGNRLAAREKAVSDRNENFVGMLKDVLTGFSVVKSFRAEKEIFGLLREKNRELEGAKYKKAFLTRTLENIGALAGVIAQFGVFLVGAYLAMKGEHVTAGVVLVFTQLLNFIIMPIGDIPKILAGRKAARGLIDKLAEALEQEPWEGRADLSEQEPEETAAGVSEQDWEKTPAFSENIPQCGGFTRGISVENVDFSYQSDTPVLKNINVRFETGKSYAIVGSSGSGKSTLLKLLMKGREDYSGRILFNGEDLHGMPTEELYSQVSLIQQNVFVFNSTIRENITMFREFPEEKLQRVIGLSGLDELLEQKGREYPCGENGSGLSGGERQRIAIARCLLRETPVLLADEATAALDAATAFSVFRAILELPGLTRIMVTHSLEEELLKRYDAILVMKNGRIEEQGTFRELMERKGYFYSLFTVAQ